jgi:predicted dehydrogenase
VRVGVVGVGIAGSSHLFDLACGNGFKITAVCASRQERADHAAGLFGASSAYTDYGQMIASEHLDGLIIAVPPTVSATVLRCALAAGIPTLIDKPAAAYPSDLRRLISAGRDEAVVAYNRRYQSHVHRARDLLALGPSESVQGVHCHWVGPFVSRYKGIQTCRREARLGHGVLLDTMSHVLDTLAFLGFEKPDVKQVRLVTGASGVDVAAELVLAQGEFITPIEIDIAEGSDERWAISIRGALREHLVLTREQLTGIWQKRDVLVAGEDLSRPVDDLPALVDQRPTLGASLAEAAKVLDTVQTARTVADLPRRPWIRPRAKALGRLNGAC